MIDCDFCWHPMTGYGPTKGLTEGLAQTLGAVTATRDCTHCGARYEITVRLVSKPKLSREQIERIKNVPR